MGDSGSKKRKSSEDASSQTKKSKVGSKSKSGSGTVRELQISKLVRPPLATPVLAVTEGSTLTDVVFRPYDRFQNPKRKNKGPPAETALHSTSHQFVDYTGREDRLKGTETALRHFIGILDPNTGKMELVESRRMLVRGSARARKASDEAFKAPAARQAHFDMKTELGEAFGTRKAKKALKSVTENTLVASGDPSKMGTGDVVLMDTIKDATENMATREDLQAAIEDARPVPRGHYDAEVIQDVYIPTEIIGAEILNAIPVLEWQEAVKAKEPINVPSRFVAHRINRVAHNENATQRLKVMRYLLCMIIFLATARPGKERGTKSIAKRDMLRTSMPGTPDVVIESIRRKFSDNGVMRKAHIDLLMTHICVFACLIDNYEVNTMDLREDLKMEPKVLNQYFMEIGARITQSKKAGKQEHIAKLMLPLQFPQVRQARQSKR
ncbi:DNA-directed RNA polymerase I subunit rpa49 [Echria macrotheca]|uniref:DNA-directed RNA polymerase I subunit rpa49 n=1 Tax=Echria macrotheca TaxID=438768 RepID=A0AAJ0F5V7_9PEZI|nr:DNA-directed RNA polymerase I subunit rpa49 [Echria macrotheca]